MNSYLRPRGDDLPDEPVSIDVLRAWLPVRTELEALGCPHRAPWIGPDEALCWDDEVADDLPESLPTVVPGYARSIVAVGDWPGITYRLAAYRAADMVIVLQLKRAESGRAMYAWVCSDQREAAWIAAGEAQQWGGFIGLDVMLTMSGMSDDDEVDANREDVDAG